MTNCNIRSFTIFMVKNTGFQNREWCGTKGTSNWIELDFGSAVGIREVTFMKTTQENYVKSFSIQYIGIQGNVLQNYGNDLNHATVSIFMQMIQNIFFYLLH
jgi:hypothetical protein